MSIVITGASGHLGRSTAELVLGRVPASEVILTRGPAPRGHRGRQSSGRAFQVHRGELMQGVST